jgi:HD-like signal output (HDOD) protein
MSAAAEVSESGAIAANAFAFVQELAEELSQARIELPSFPNVVARIRRALSDESVSIAKISRIVSAEPALATRILTMANSAALNLSGKQVTDLRTAIARMGFNLVRSAAISFAFEQLRNAEALKGLEAELDVLWQRSVLMAAMCHVVARRHSELNADGALLAGLLHGVGKLYILTRAKRHPRLFAAQSTYAEIVHDWHANIAKALLESWEIAPDIVEAVHTYENPLREPRGPVNFTDVLAVASLLASFLQAPDQLEIDVQALKACARLRLARADCGAILRASQQEIAELQAALGD